ncbi:hypothetical protein [Vulcanisaeta distributa]|uniref:Uncharacterized protein n=1 Tax=Vulcanisaeta distributa (strain DSM 14429 / JCM 11212 / NBRC 100878 / IC-017) TaxID=572478 RepID=E1QTK4_VULDI|nr:hypothetical protein [Vulcanisaeta distributa]ADN49719.1 conserved hypothetical protein [Vulcanisaeta distributa DSM 14429]
MRKISYSKLMSFIRGNPLYEVREGPDTVELLFHAPSEEEAAGTEFISSDEPRPVMRIVFARVGDELIPREAWVERGNVIQRMSIDELDTWLEFVDMYS